MAMYDSSAYDFEIFSPKPKRTEQQESGFEPRIVRAPKKSVKQKNEERVAFNRKLAKILSITLALFVLFGFRIYLQVSLTEKTRELDQVNADIKVAQSENVSLNSRLYELMSLDTVEKKAVNELHMVKRDASQIRYIAVGSTDNYTDGVRVSENDNKDDEKEVILLADETKKSAEGKTAAAKTDG